MTEQFSLSQSQNAESSLCAASALSMHRGGRSYIISSQCRDHRSRLQQDLKMRPANDLDSRVARILAKESEVKQLRVDAHARKIDVGFYSPPSLELFQRVEMQVRREFDGEWEISVQPNAPSALFHRHRINDHITEFHRAHPTVARSGRHMWNECAGGFRLPARCVSRVANHRLIYCRIHCWRLVCHTGCLAGTQAAKDRRPVSDDLCGVGRRDSSRVD